MPRSYGYQPTPKGKRPRREASLGDDGQDPVDEID